MDILYSFRRCPYAIRARLAIALVKRSVELREVQLKNKPEAMLQASPKGTVPVLVTESNEIIDESLDIMHWAISQQPMDNFIGFTHEAIELITQNDNEFKGWLDRYKYADRFPEHDEMYYFEQAQSSLIHWNERLSHSAYLLGETPSVADLAIFPFVRQFAQVNRPRFDQAGLSSLKEWLENWLNSPLFLSCMTKEIPWLASKQGVRFPSVT